MDIDVYYTFVKGKQNKPCVVKLIDGQTEEGVYLKENLISKGLGMTIRPTGKTKERYANVGVSDPNPQLDLGDTLEIKNISILISDIDTISFTDENS